LVCPRTLLDPEHAAFSEPALKAVTFVWMPIFLSDLYEKNGRGLQALRLFILILIHNPFVVFPLEKKTA
tara:strand:- start:113 stop:319 length:207 start_codon:yes stop_codon:yes gene_type:complete